MHFLTKLLKEPEVKDPVKNAPDVHKHFTRYSKGQFDGPIIKISVIGKKISIGASFEYEDELLRLVTKYYPDPKMEISGTLMSGIDFTTQMKSFGMPATWFPEKSKGQTSSYTTVMKTKVSVDKAKLAEMAEKWSDYLYALLSFSSANKEYSITTKSKPPRPNSKNPEDSNPANLIKFCTVKLPNTPEILNDVIQAFAVDFKDEIPSKYKSLTITNVYEITDLMLPENMKQLPSAEVRLQTLRKGKIHRSVEVDGKTFSNDINFRA
jgi:hypothetical protein